MRLLRTAMAKSGSSKFLIDGFPRDMMNLECWQKEMAAVSETQFLLFLDCPQVGAYMYVCIYVCMFPFEGVDVAVFMCACLYTYIHAYGDNMIPKRFYS